MLGVALLRLDGRRTPIALLMTHFSNYRYRRVRKQWLKQELK